MIAGASSDRQGGIASTSFAGRRCILVLGMHRSGTSAFTRVLNLLGAALPKHVLGANPSNEAGYWEPERLVVLHDQMLAEAGSHWDDWRAFDPAALGPARLGYYKLEIAQLIAQEYGDAPLFVIKDPRICRFVGLYEEVLGALDIVPLYVLPVRNPLAVVKSLAARDGMTTSFASLLWLRHALESEERTRGKPRAIISYERLVDDWQAAAFDIGECLRRFWPLPPQGGAPEAEAFLSHRLTHHSPSVNELAARADIADWVKESYQVLLALEKGGDQGAGQATLDKVRAAFNGGAPIFGDAIFQELKARQSKLAEKTNKLNQELAFRDADTSRQQVEMDALRQQLTERAARVAALDQAHAARTGEAAALQQLVAARDEQIAEFEHATNVRETKLTSLLEASAEQAVHMVCLSQTIAERDETLADQRATIGALDQALMDRGKEIGALRHELEQSIEEIDALRRSDVEKDAELTLHEAVARTLYASTSWRVTAPIRAGKRLLKRLYYSRLGLPLAFARGFLTKRWRAQLRYWRAVVTIAGSDLFDRKWYLKTYPDVAARGIDPVRHYTALGAKEGRDPSPFFSTRTYLAHNPDVAVAGLNPLFHFIRHGAREGRLGGSAQPLMDALAKFGPPSTEAGSSAEHHSPREALEADCRLLRDSGLFDYKTYRSVAGIGTEIDAVEHYLLGGWREGLEPGPNFEGRYLYPYYCSVGHAGPPAITHLKLRAVGATAYATMMDAEHWAAEIRGNELFDAVGYAARHELMDELDPALHYVIIGEPMGFPPSNAFDPNYYYDRYPDISRSAISAFAHYLLFGQQEGRRSTSTANKLVLDRSRLDQRRETILLISHEASRTGAPILAWNIATRLQSRYNVVVLLLRGGELIGNFKNCCAAVVGPVDVDWHPIEAKYIVKRLLASYPITYAIANTTVSGIFVSALAATFVPVLSLIHEFASYTRPKEAMGEGLDWSTQIVFSSDITANSAKSEHPQIANRTIHVLPQGRCVVPRGNADAPPAAAEELREVFRPSGSENALVVLGVGFVHIRKGVDLFLACAAAVSTLDLKRPVRFIWIGGGYDLANDLDFSTYLGEQITRSGLEGKVAIIDAVDDLEPAYAMSDVFFLSSRLDPLPNVTIDAAFHGLPVLCFENASGMAALLAAEASLRPCVVPYLDVNAAAQVIAKFANDEEARSGTGRAMRCFAEATFDMDRYVNRLDELGREAIDLMRQRERDFITLRDDPLFDEAMFRQPDSATATRDDAIRQFLGLWTAVGYGKAGFRRPTAGFHPKIYAHGNSERYATAVVNPLAHFIRSKKPDGPWHHDVINPTRAVHRAKGATKLRVGVHAHFHYPELVTDFLSKIACNHSACDLLLTTNDNTKAKLLRQATAQYQLGEVSIRIVPNRGRDIGPLLTDFADEIVQRYDVIGHVHGKRSLMVDAALGETWREFLWQNLLGELHPMMDVIVQRFVDDEGLGLVFPSDPHLCDWDSNRGIAEDLAKCIGIREALPPFFEFPVGTMFWARVDALRPLFDLRLGWDDYPEEPLPFDGTILHALERLLPFVARHAGYRFATTYVPGVTR